MRKRPKYKIQEIRDAELTSKFFLKEKVLFWWQKVEVLPYHIYDRYNFVRLSTGVDYVNKRRGELVSIEVKINKKKK